MITFKDFIPPLFIHLYTKSFAPGKTKEKSEYGFSGNYSSWDEAVKNSSGYNSEIIFSKVKSAALKVKNGEAAFERDSVLFYEMEYSWHLLAVLLRIAASNHNKLNVLDFGGALGSSYFQNREFLSVIDSLVWNIVEQPQYVRCGKEHFENKQLRFYYTIDECLNDNNPNVLLLSGVIQYLESPYNFLKNLLEKKIAHIIIDRTGFLPYDGSEIITIQYISPDIFDAKIPVHIFNFNKFINTLKTTYNIISVFDCEKVKYSDKNTGVIGLTITHKGLILNLK